MRHPGRDHATHFGTGSTRPRDPASPAAPEFLVQPRPGERPQPIRRAGGDAHQPGDFGKREAGEVAELDQFRRLPVGGRQLGQRLVEFYEILAGFQFSLVMIRLAAMFVAEAGDESIGAMAIYNPVVGITADKLGIPRPVPPGS